MGFDSEAKGMHRAGIVSLHIRNAHLPILYLDGEDGAATFEFRTVWKIPARLLVPVNFDETVITSIQADNPGVKGKVGNIDTILEQEGDDSYSAVWLDYMCRFDARIHASVFRDALRVSQYALVTFSTRAVDKTLTAEALTRTMKKIGKIVESITPYKGKSDVENMIKFTITRKTPNDRWLNDDDGDDDDAITVGTLEEEKDTFAVRPRDKVIVTYRKHRLTAVVMDTSGDDVLVRFDCDAEQRWVPSSKVEMNSECVDTSLFIGKEIAAPLKIFRGKLQGHECTKKTAKKIFFTIGKRHRNSPRFTVHAVMKNGTIHKKAECWTISPEEAACWVR